MKTLIIIFTVVFSTVVFISCNDMRKKVDEKIDNLLKKTESIDSLIINEVDKVLELDTLISTGNEKVKKLDSIVDKSTVRLDSITNKVINPENR